MPEAQVDLAIVGAGLVGLSLACALRGSALRIALVDRAPPPAAAPADADWDVRVYAISPGSEGFLSACGAWPQHARMAPVLAMEVFGDDGASRIDFDAHRARVAHLAHIVENRALLDSLWARVRASDVEVRAPARCAGVAFGPPPGVAPESAVADSATLSFEDGPPLHARLLVAADGAQSWLRAQAGLEAAITPYGHTAVVAHFACEAAHDGRALQWFRRDGVLALLPLPGNRCSLVWSAMDSVAAELMAAGAQALAQRVAEASGYRLGALEQITAPAAFPLQLVRVPRLVAPRLALVGDAAHNLHPLAGQGVNLGFQDARELAQALRARGACSDVGEYRLLRRYERARSEDVLAMTLVTDGLKLLFNNRIPPLAWLRNRGLNLVDRATALKHLLVRHALG
jgi:ubiquinone biosynthesis UbiH/UbiF/VisC/COQ6 family hydroxylase